MRQEEEEDARQRKAEGEHSWRMKGSLYMEKSSERALTSNCPD